jgi:alkaline phosphatase D
MRHSRRTILGVGVSLAGAALAVSRSACAVEIAFNSSPFTLGVASGYPEPNAVVLWTRLAPEPLAPDGGLSPATVEVAWEVATDEHLRTVVRRGTSYATPDFAHSVHVEVAGLEPARDYWYRFTCGGQQSPVGRTRTAAARGTLPARFSLALASCQHYEQGHYAAYRAIAADAPDLVVHVGDYIYEGRGQQGRVRSHDAPECHTLEDYRQRYAIYKSDPSLQAAHAMSPWMLVSDDHEVANDYAGEHSPQNDAPEWFLARRAAAYRAYYEHQPMPRRLVPLDGRQRLYATRNFGDLVSLHMLDGRQHRSRQACGPTPLAEPCAELVRGDRSMLGDAQERWLETTLAASQTRWNLLGQQTLFAHFDQSGPGPLAYWMDGWNGYPAARSRLVQFLAAREIANPVVLSGDIHAFLVNDVHLETRDPKSPIVATELVTSSISSQGPPQRSFDAWVPENPNVRLARGDERGYVRVGIEPARLTAELVAVDDVTRADSPTHLLAQFEVASGQAGIVR